ncbi:hypothetical protein D0Y50_18565 [Salinimonas sediminis]|uniref:Uncharacterized protein n=1 Tax=Salinimonas sediminis TaxID=2303538 RepID=A0A346NRM4_9ALTE|nr:hypothetical protein D0Y50_18565 [Salinimonas sediminis]
MLYFVTATKKPLSFDKGFFVEWACFTASRGGCATQSAFLIPERAVGCSDKWVSLLRHGFAALNREITLANLLAVKTKKAPVFRQGLLRRIGLLHSESWRLCYTKHYPEPYALFCHGHKKAPVFRQGLLRRMGLLHSEPWRLCCTKRFPDT